MVAMDRPPQPQWLPPVAPVRPSPSRRPGPRPARRRRSALAAQAPGVLGFLIAAGVIVLSYGTKLKGLLLILPKLKLLTTSGSMLVSIGAYSLIWGWSFAVGFVLLLLRARDGPRTSSCAARAIEAGALVFIPFLGAAVWAKSLGGNALAEARVGLAGPVLGSLGAAALIPVAHFTGNELFQALAFVGFFLNLFNLLPVLPLDGGRAMAAMAPWMWFAGLSRPWSARRSSSPTR